MDELKEYLDYLIQPDSFYCINNCNVNRIFTKNKFFTNSEDIIKFIKNTNYDNCYINYNPLLKDINRKTENIKKISFIGLDIECVDKEDITDENRLNNIKEDYVNKIISFQEIKNYMLTCSGNGYHLYIKIDCDFEQEKISSYKYAYKKIVEKINELMNGHIKENLYTCTDRKDIAGILRLPTMLNKKCNRRVKLIEIKNEGINKNINNMMNKFVKEYEKPVPRKTKLITKKLIEKEEDIESHPLVRLWIEENLPNNTDKHKTIGFALQNLVYYSKLQNSLIIKEIQDRINNKYNISLNLYCCSEVIDINAIYFISLKYCRENNIDNKYIEEFKSMLLKN